MFDRPCLPEGPRGSLTSEFLLRRRWGGTSGWTSTRRRPSPFAPRPVEVTDVREILVLFDVLWVDETLVPCVLVRSFSHVSRVLRLRMPHTHTTHTTPCTSYTDTPQYTPQTTHHTHHTYTCHTQHTQNTHTHRTIHIHGAPPKHITHTTHT